jgi:hypothetical protein
MKMHHPSQAVADCVSVRTLLLAGVSVLSAGMIAASPAPPPQADHTVALTPLAANSALVPAAAPAAPDRKPSASSGATSVAAAAPAAAQPMTAAAPGRPGVQLSLLTGSPNLGAGNVGNFNTGVNNTFRPVPPMNGLRRRPRPDRHDASAQRTATRPNQQVLPVTPNARPTGKARPPMTLAQAGARPGTVTANQRPPARPVPAGTGALPRTTGAAVRKPMPTVPAGYSVG